MTQFETYTPEEIGINPYSAYGTLGDGVRTFVDSDGNVQAIPNTAPILAEPTWPRDGAEIPQNSYDVPAYLAPGEVQELLHQQVHGVPWQGYEVGPTVNPSNPGVPNLGPPTQLDYQTGDTQIRRHVPGAEQGWGLDLAVLVPRYPHCENANPTYSYGIHRRNGALEYVPDPQDYAEVTAGAYERQWEAMRRTGSHQNLVANPAAVSYSSTVHVQYGQPLLAPDNPYGYPPAWY